MDTLDQLPTEIIQEILFYTSSEDNLTLAKVCKRLNSLALLHFFRSSCGIPEPSQLFPGMILCGSPPHTLDTEPIGPTETKRIYAFSGLSIMFSSVVPTIDTLTISMQLCSREDHAHHITENYQRLTHTVKKLNHIRNVVISLNLLDLIDKRPDLAKQASKHPDRKGVVAALLNTVLEKGCEELVLHNSAYIPQQRSANDIKLLTAFQKLRSVVLGPIGGPGRALAPYFTQDPIQLPTAVRNSCKLKRLEISGTMLLSPPFSYWTYCVLDTPALTSLTLHSIWMRQKHWKVLLSWLYHPLRSRLTELAMTNCYALPTKALVKFLSKLEKVTHFQITTNGPLTKPTNPRCIVFFPGLVSITAPESWISFLCPETVPRPALKHIHIVCPTTFHYGTCISELGALLNPSFSSPASNSEQPVTIVLDVKELFDAAYLKTTFLRYSDPATRESGFEAYDRVTALWFNFSVVSQDSITIFCQFLGWWKHLQVVQFYPVSWQPSSSWQGGSLQGLLNTAKVHCPGVQKFVIYEQEYLVHGS